MPDYVDHLTKTIAFAGAAVQEARETMETADRRKVAIKLTQVGDLLLKAHSEILAAVMSLDPR